MSFGGHVQDMINPKLSLDNPNDNWLRRAMLRSGSIKKT